MCTCPQFLGKGQFFAFWQFLMVYFAIIGIDFFFNFQKKKKKIILKKKIKGCETSKMLLLNNCYLAIFKEKWQFWDI